MSSTVCTDRSVTDSLSPVGETFKLNTDLPLGLGGICEGDGANWSGTCSMMTFLMGEEELGLGVGIFRFSGCSAIRSISFSSSATMLLSQQDDNDSRIRSSRSIFVNRWMDQAE
jgi:hypothetical protein